MTAPSLESRIEQALGLRPAGQRSLAGGCVGDVRLIEFDSGDRVVAKVDPRAGGQLEIEARMLRFLRERTATPVPEVLHSEQGLLLMEFVEGSSSPGAEAERHAAEILAALHDIPADAFGFDFDTLIGGLPQPNGWMPDWRAFFGERRLRFMAREARRAGRLPEDLDKRVSAAAERLDDILEPPDSPSLVHGDVWSGNVLTSGGRVTALLDPALYFAHPEVELAFITLFGTFGDAFFERYQTLRPITPGFFERRRDVYNLFPLLVHVRLFGGGYVASLDATLRRIGC